MNYKHGGRHTRLYNIWRSMRQRCNNPKASNYGRYGGRGITVCQEWNSFIAFSDWAYMNGYCENLTLDRIDNMGNYEPTNCQWVSYVVQNRNRRDNVRLTYNGDTHTIAEWAEIIGIKPGTLYARVECGYSTEDALTLPLKYVRDQK